MSKRGTKNICSEKDVISQSHVKKGMLPWVMSLLVFFGKNSSVSTFEQLAARVGKSIANVRRYLDNYVVTSINKNRMYVISKATLVRKQDRYGFFYHEPTGAVFHRMGNIKDVLIFLAKNIDWGITDAEAEQRCGRSCTRALQELLEEGKLMAARVNGVLVYLHPKRYKIQFRNRLTNKRVCPQTSEQTDEPPILPLEEILETIRSQEGLDRELKEQVCVILLQYYEQETYRGLEARLLLDVRLREMLNIPLHEVPDHTTLWRIFANLTVDQVNKLFTLLVVQLKSDGVIEGQYLVVDATHIFAWASTRKNINDHEIIGAAWGVHQGNFYGYKVHILIDAEAELPVAIKLSHGNAADRDWVIPLLDSTERTIGIEEIKAIFGDAAYYDEPLFKEVRERYGVTLNATINPRRNKTLKRIKKWVAEIFQEHRNEIETVDDALARMPQKFLTAFGADVGSTKENMVTSAIRERLYRHLRSAVERVFSRAKQFFWLERPRTRDIGRVVKHVLMGFIAMLLVALTGTRLGWERNTLALARVY